MTARLHGEDPAPTSAVDARSDEWRDRWDSAREALRGRFEEPVKQATRLTRRTLAWFPVRVWRHFLQNNGFLLAAGVSYQSLFAIFSAIYLAFAIVGLWVGGSKAAVDRLISLINDYIPGLISDRGLVKPEQVEDVASGSTSLLSVTGAIALVVVIWTAIGFVTFSRRAVRDIFGLPYDARSYILLKARDLLAALTYGVALLIGAGLGQIGTWALHLVFRLIGWEVSSEWFAVTVRVLTIAVGVRDQRRRTRGALPAADRNIAALGADLARCAAGRRGPGRPPDRRRLPPELHPEQPAAGDLRDLHRIPPVVPFERHRAAGRGVVDRRRHEGPRSPAHRALRGGAPSRRARRARARRAGAAARGTRRGGRRHLVAQTVGAPPRPSRLGRPHRGPRLASGACRRAG